MAFRIVDTVHASDPEELLEGYVLPYSWLRFCITHGLVEIMDEPYFRNTLQGSLYTQLEMDNVSPIIKENGKWSDRWYVYLGDGEVEEIILDANTDEDWDPFYDSRFGQNIYPRTLQYIASRPRWERKVINESIKQLLRGCRIRLLDSEWTTLSES